MLQALRPLQRPTVVSDADLAAALPIPAELADDDPDELRRNARVAFNRFFFRNECIAFNYMGGVTHVPTSQTMGCLDCVLRCSVRTPATSAFLTTPLDARMAQGHILRRHFRDTPGWLEALAAVQVYVRTGSVEDGPSADVIAAWERVAFDRREPARDALLRRRRLELIRVRGRELLAHPPAPGHPTAAEVEAHFDFVAHFGTRDQILTMFTPDPPRDRARLFLALRGAFPGWEPRRACGRLIEAWHAPSMAALLPAWEAAGFERNVTDYLRLTLDTAGDREAALCSLVRTHGARITPRIAYDACDANAGDFDDDAIATQMTRFIETAWLPVVRPDRCLVETSAMELQSAHGCSVTRSFLTIAMPDLLDWPCAADTAYVASLLGILSGESGERTTLLSLVLAERIPEGAQHMSYQDIRAFLEPLVALLPIEADLLAVIAQFIDTWTRHIPDIVRDCLVDLTEDADTQASIGEAVERQRQRVEFTEWRETVAAKRCARFVRDTLAPEDAPDEVTCIACRSNLRRVCFVPCGHIVTCIECASQCDKTCPVCRAAVTSAQPCILPTSST